MLKLKIYANENLQIPETVMEAENTVDLIDPVLLSSPMTGHYKGIYGRLRRAARYTGLPMWGVLRSKAFQSSAFLVDQMVKNGLAEWLIFDAELFDPVKAVRRKRQKQMDNNQAKARVGRNKYLANLTAEDREKLGAAISAGHAKRKAKKLTKMPIDEAEKLRLAEERKQKRLEKKLARQIASGRVPASADEIPDWFKMPGKSNN
jgi:hypothetical protein